MRAVTILRRGTSRLFSLAAVMFILTLVENNFFKSDKWELIRSNSHIEFSAARVVLSPVKGKVTNFSAVLNSFSDNDFSGAEVEVKASVSSITTGVLKRDAELKSPNYFNAAKFPDIIFKSKSFKKAGSQLYEVAGDLTMHGITKPVKLKAHCTLNTDSKNQTQTAVFKISTLIDRLDFAIGKGTSANLVSNEVQLNSVVEFRKTIDISR